MPEFTTSRAHFADFPHRLWPEESCAFTAKFCHYHLHRRSSRSRAIELPGGIGGSMREPGGIHEMYSITCIREYPAPSFEKTFPSGRTIEKDGAERGSRANEPAGPSVVVSWFCVFMLIFLLFVLLLIPDRYAPVIPRRHGGPIIRHRIVGALGRDRAVRVDAPDGVHQQAVPLRVVYSDIPHS